MAEMARVRIGLSDDQQIDVSRPFGGALQTRPASERPQEGGRRPLDARRRADPRKIGGVGRAGKGGRGGARRGDCRALGSRQLETRAATLESSIMRWLARHSEFDLISCQGANPGDSGDEGEALAERRGEGGQGD
jgi:hypothetical protein